MKFKIKLMNYKEDEKTYKIRANAKDKIYYLKYIHKLIESPTTLRKYHL